MSLDLSGIGKQLLGRLGGKTLEVAGTLAALEHSVNAAADEAEYAPYRAAVAAALGIDEAQTKTLLKGLGDIAHSTVRGSILPF